MTISHRKKWFWQNHVSEFPKQFSENLLFSRCQNKIVLSSTEKKIPIFSFHKYQQFTCSREIFWFQWNCMTENCGPPLATAPRRTASLCCPPSPLLSALMLAVLHSTPRSEPNTRQMSYFFTFSAVAHTIALAASSRLRTVLLSLNLPPLSSETFSLGEKIITVPYSTKDMFSHLFFFAKL